MEMSRSRRKTAIIGVTTAPSDKPFKVDEHRAERHAVRAVAAKLQMDAEMMADHPVAIEISSPVIEALAAG
jgi:hypothetical protein